jgi:hypothetical protein
MLRWLTLGRQAIGNAFHRLSVSTPRSDSGSSGSGRWPAWACALCLSIKLRAESEHAVGKWASQKKAGGQGMFGYVPPPVAGDFSITTPGTPSTLITRNTALDSIRTHWVLRSIRLFDGLDTVGTPLIGATSGAATPGSGVSYRVMVAWGNVNGRISEFFNLGTFTVP